MTCLAEAQGTALEHDYLYNKKRPRAEGRYIMQQKNTSFPDVKNVILETFRAVYVVCRSVC